MKSSYGVALLASTFLVMPASAQTFNQFVGFGDSTIDSGYFKYSSFGTPAEARFAAARAGGATITPSSGVMNSEILASSFGLTASPANAPGGGSNYAVSGARISENNISGATNSPSFVGQINNYLVANGGVANPNALYLLSVGGNDLTQAGSLQLTGAAFRAFMDPYIANAVSAASKLQAAGARYIVFTNDYGLGNGPAYYNQNLWNGLAAAGVNFIPADIRSMTVAIRNDPARFGFVQSSVGAAPGTTVNSSNSSCHAPNTGMLGGYGLICVPNTPPSNVTAYLNGQDSQQNRLFSDNSHFSPAGQKIEADYIYSLIVAPSQISFLTESTIQARRGVTVGIQEQIDITQRRGTPGFNVWFNGDVSSLKLNNSSPGFPGDPSTPVSGTLGGSYSFSPNALIGAAVTLGQFDPTFSSGGGFREQEVAATIFGAVRADSLWANAIMSFGWLKYDVNRVVPLGITFDSNQASTRGRNFSFAALTGYDFRSDAITHGPVVGVEVQSVGIDSFTETGSFTSLAFSNIGRTSTVSALGYRAAIDYGNWRPFAQVTWNHEFDDTANRTITATLTSVAAPSYSMPIVQLGRDWASATVGTTVTLAKDWTGLAAFNAQLGQNGTTNYGGRFGINYAFNSTALGLPVKAKY